MIKGIGFVILFLISNQTASHSQVLHDPNDKKDSKWRLDQYNVLPMPTYQCVYLLLLGYYLWLLQV